MGPGSGVVQYAERPRIRSAGIHGVPVSMTALLDRVDSPERLDVALFNGNWLRVRFELGVEDQNGCSP